MAGKIKVEVKDRGLLKAKEAAGLSAFKKLEMLLTKKDIENIEKSYKLFRTKFKLG
jgi:hypothetical protein